MKIRKRWIGAAAVLALLVSAVAIAQVTLVTSEWSSGNLVFKKVSDGSTLFTFNTSGINFAAPGNLLIGGTALTPTAAELNEYLITIHDVDVCDTTSVYAVLPHAGTLNSALDRLSHLGHLDVQPLAHLGPPVVQVDRAVGRNIHIGCSVGSSHKV